MPNVLYVGNLGHDVDRDEVLRLFGVHGVVRWAELVQPSRTPGATGAALVEMASAEGAAAAIEALHGAPLRGGPLIVGRTNEQQPEPSEDQSPLPPIPPPVASPVGRQRNGAGLRLR